MITFAVKILNLLFLSSIQFFYFLIFLWFRLRLLGFPQSWHCLKFNRGDWFDEISISIPSILDDLFLFNVWLLYPFFLRRVFRLIIKVDNCSTPYLLYPFSFLNDNLEVLC